MSEFKELAEGLGAGAAFLLLVAVFGAAKGWWVPAYIYKAKEKECEEWKRLALEGTSRLRNAVEVLKQ